MEQQQRYTLGKADKLKSRKLIEQLFKEAKSFAVFPLRVLYLETPATSHLQTAFSVSKKHFKKAVDRNRVKRLMREAWRLQKNMLRDKLEQTNKPIAVFIMYTGNELPPYQLIYEKTGAVIRRLIKISHETVVTNT